MCFTFTHPLHITHTLSFLGKHKFNSRSKPLKKRVYQQLHRLRTYACSPLFPELFLTRTNLIAVFTPMAYYRFLKDALLANDRKVD